MRFKNNLHPELPRPVLLALIESNDTYKEDLSRFLSGPGIPQYDHAISVTSLISPPRQVQLIARHNDEIEKDPLDMLYSMKGTIIHHILERYAKRDPDYLAEERRGRIINYMGKRIFLHGQFDLYGIHTKKLFDFKYTAEQSLNYDKTEHDWQLNVLKWISRKTLPMDELANLYILKHIENRWLEKNGFPVKGIIHRAVEIKPEDEVKSYIASRLKSHLKSLETPDNELSHCSDKERWYEPEYKVYKETKKGPISQKACFTSMSRQECEDYAAALGVSFEIRKKKDHPTRCMHWCDAAPFCNQYSEHIDELQFN